MWGQHQERHMMKCKSTTHLQNGPFSVHICCQRLIIIIIMIIIHCVCVSISHNQPSVRSWWSCMSVLRSWTLTRLRCVPRGSSTAWASALPCSRRRWRTSAEAGGCEWLWPGKFLVSCHTRGHNVTPCLSQNWPYWQWGLKLNLGYISLYLSIEWSWNEGFPLCYIVSHISRAAGKWWTKRPNECAVTKQCVHSASAQWQKLSEALFWSMQFLWLIPPSRALPQQCA